MREGGVEARAVVAHVAADAAVRGGSHSELDRGVAAAAGELPGVVQQLVQHLADEVGVGHGPGWLLDRAADAAARVPAPEPGSDGGGLGAEIDLLEADRCPGDAGQVQQIIENTSHVLAGGLDPLSVAAAILTEGIAVILDQGGAESGQRAQWRPQVVRQGIGEGSQVLVDPAEIVACLPLLGDITHGGRYQEALAGVEGGQGDLGGEGGAVAAAAGQVQARAHLPGPGAGRVPGAQAGVGGLARVGDQDLDRLPGQLLARVPEHLLRLGVHQHDPPAGVDAHRRVRRRLQQPGNDGIGDRPHGQARSVLGNLLKVMIPHSSAAGAGAGAVRCRDRGKERRRAPLGCARSGAAVRTDYREPGGCCCPPGFCSSAGPWDGKAAALVLPW